MKLYSYAVLDADTMERIGTFISICNSIHDIWDSVALCFKNYFIRRIENEKDTYVC